MSYLLKTSVGNKNFVPPAASEAPVVSSEKGKAREIHPSTPRKAESPSRSEEEVRHSLTASVMPGSLPEFEESTSFMTAVPAYRAPAEAHAGIAAELALLVDELHSLTHNTFKSFTGFM